MPTGPKVTMTLQSISRSRTATGGWTESYSAAETLKGVLMANTGDETFTKGKDTVVADYTFIVSGKTATRTARNISEGQRIIYGSRTFDILFVDDNLSMNNFIHLKLQEVK